MDNQQPDILHVTTVHRRTDTRIVIKELKVAQSVCPGKTWLAVADGAGDAQEGETTVVDIGKPSGGRGARAISGSWRLYRLIKRLRPKIVHFHDPELLFLGYAAKLSGCRLIYDVHEDVPRQIRGKYWLPKMVRPVVSILVAMAEWMGARIFDAIVAATPIIAARFPSGKTIVVQNFPILNESPDSGHKPYKDREQAFAYIGTIARIRSALEMVKSLDYFTDEQPARLRIAGSFDEKKLEEEVRILPGWDRVRFEDWLDRKAVANLLGEVRGGLVLFYPTSNNQNGYPVKMFEYMSAALPVIASDFPLWRSIVDKTGCGLLVDSQNPEAIAEAMHWILEHSDEAEEMGRRGRRAIEEKYNWETEAGKLSQLYLRLLNS